MLSKLLKYEFRATGRTFLPMYAILLVMSAVAHLAYSGALERPNAIGWLQVVITLIMVMLFTAVWVITLAVIIRRFWRNLLGREGYLMNVLPVSPAQHIGAKLLTAAVWTILSVIVSALAAWIMLGGAIDLAFEVDWPTVRAVWQEAWAGLRGERAAGLTVLMLVQGVLCCLSGLAMAILSVYAAMCIGQLTSRHRVWASIGAYLGVNIVFSTVSSWIIGGRIAHYTVRPLPDEGTRTALLAINTEMLLYFAVCLLFSVALFIACDQLMKRRLNLQ